MMQTLVARYTGLLQIYTGRSFDRTMGQMCDYSPPTLKLQADLLELCATELLLQQDIAELELDLAEVTLRLAELGLKRE
jgi:hypothetical protein